MNTSHLEDNPGKVIDIIKKRATTTRDSFETLGMALILHKIQFDSRYDVNRDPTVISAVRNASMRLNKGLINALLEKWLRQIEFDSSAFIKNYQFSDDRCNTWALSICTLSEEIFRKEFSKHDFKTQFAILHCQLELLMLPQTECVVTLAKNGEQMVQFLTEKLELTNDLNTIELALRVFMQMDKNGFYRLSKKTALTTLLKKKNALLDGRLGSWHRSYELWLDSLN